MIEKTAKAILAVALLALVVSGYSLLSPYLQPSKETIKPASRVLYVKAVEPKGAANVKDEPAPTKPLPMGGGYVYKSPDKTGRWEVSSYTFLPDQITVYQGDKVELNFFGINGKLHTIMMEKYVKEFKLHRGELVTVSFTADAVGTFEMHCDEHKPSMHGYLTVLPRP